MAIDIEVIATSAVKKTIARTDYLLPYVQDKDKEPIWDGHIYAYGHKKKSNDSFRGRAPVQVKGKVVKSFNKSRYTYSVSISNLKKYCLDGGVIYFVVLMDKDGENETIYYANLLPYMINNYIKMTNKKSVSIILKRFPKEKNEIENLVFNFITDRDKQVLLRKGENITLEDIANRIDLEKVTYGFSFSAIGYENADVNPFSYMSKHDMYFYAFIPELNAYTVINHMEEFDEARRKIQCNISVNGKRYYNSVTLIQNRDMTILQIGSCFNIAENKDGTGKYNFTLTGSLNDRILGAEFIIDLVTEKGFEIDNRYISFKPNDEEMANFDINWLNKQLVYLKLVRKMLDNLGVDDDLDCKNLTEKEHQYIEMLLRTILYNQTVGVANNEKIPPVVTLSISNLVLILYFKEQADGRYIIKNFCDIEMECSADKNDGKLFLTSQYTIMREEDFCKISNYDFDKAKKSLFAINNPGHLERVTMYLLEMIKSYDSSGKSVLLNEAQEVAKWLYEMEGTDISLVNLLQVYKRKGALSSENIDMLIDLEERNRDSLELSIGINILLENYLVVERKFDKLEGMGKETFMSWPIYTLWRKEQKNR